jgi:hypothetical protein
MESIMRVPNKTDKYKLIEIEKYSQKTFFWENLFKHKKIENLSVEEVIENYMGFEGELISYSLISQEELISESIVEYIKLPKQSILLLLVPTRDKASQIPHFIKLGYDFGLCEGEQAIYSSIFHEVLFGNAHELISFKTVLNDNLLFPSQNLAIAYSNKHHELLLAGRDVEGEEEMKIYEIWKPNF